MDIANPEPQAIPPQESDAAFLSEEEWGKLIRFIRHGQVIPVVGRDMITISNPADGKPVLLYRWLAPELARRLGLKNPDECTSINEAVSTYLLERGQRDNVYHKIGEIFDEVLTDLDQPPSAGLLSLARVSDFNLFVTSAVDHQLAKALKAERPGFESTKQLIPFVPSTPVDLPEPLGGTCLFCALGHYRRTFPDFAVWDEDYIEYIYGFIEKRDTLERLFRQLNTRFLLLLGAPASDWIVRFLIRVARKERLSDRSVNKPGEFFADVRDTLEPPLVDYFDKFIQTTRFINDNPVAFAEELCRRWEKLHGQAVSEDEFLARIPDAMPKDAIFISYASEDLAAALAVARGLHAVGVPVWLDKARLKAGENYETSLEAAVRVHCSFFISLISDATEADAGRGRYVHKERDWAAARHMDGFIFYIPADIRPPGAPRAAAEPACFSKIHYHRLPGGTPTPDFIRRLRELVDAYRDSGRPRG